MNYYKLTIIIAFLFVVQANEFNLILMVEEMMKYFFQPTKITLLWCDNFEKEAVNFLKHLSINGYMVNSQKLNFQPMSYPNAENHKIFVLNIHCKDALKFLHRANELKLFATPYRWLLINDTTNHQTTKISDLKTIDILVDSQFFLANFKSEDKCTLQVLYKRKSNLPIIVETIAFWSREEGLIDAVAEKTIAKRRKNLMGTKLSTCIVITHNDTLNHLTDKKDKHIDSITKVNYVIMMHLSDIINSTFIYSIQSTWGYKDKNSQWSGMIGELVRKEVDVGGTPSFVTIDRVPVIDYIAMTTPTKSKFVFRQPKLSYETNVFALPFHWSVWISVLALMFITGFTLYLVVKWEWSKKKYVIIINESNENELRDNWHDIVFLTFGAFCQQGTNVVPYSFPGRIITILLFISLMFLYTSYSATIVALLQSSSSNIKTLNDLLRSRLSVGVDDTVFNHFYFPNATEPVRKALYLQKVVPPGQKPRFFPIAEGVSKMRQGLFAFHMETGAGYKIVGETFQEDEKCGLQEIQFLQVPDPYIAIQKNSSFKEILKIGLRLIHETGIQTREVSLLYTKKPQCISRGTSFISVGIIDCYFAAVVFLGGLIISIGIFIIEIVANNRIKAYQIKHSKLKIGLKNHVSEETITQSYENFPFVH